MDSSYYYYYYFHSHLPQAGLEDALSYATPRWIAHWQCDHQYQVAPIPLAPPAHVTPPTPESPPPPYDEIENGYQYQPVQPSLQMEQWQMTPQPSTENTQPNRLRKKASAWVVSKLDAGRGQSGNEHGGGQEWQSQAVSSHYGQTNYTPLVQSMNQSAALCDRVAARLNDVFSCEGEDIVLHDLERGLSLQDSRAAAEQSRKNAIIDFKKTWLYANSRLPPHMPPMKFYLDTWRLLCVAAQASIDAYRRPRKDERADRIEADWRNGTKAMVIQSRPIDDKNTIVLAIRGSRKNLMDWSVNFGTAPTEPRGFLDDEGNACHAGFLQVARKSVPIVAARLLSLLDQRWPGAPKPSLLITGHSAGGAVASLLYMHMMAITPGVDSELNILTHYFLRISCITFGVPPLSLLPLQKPVGKQYPKSDFFAFANEGDLVVRADRQYLRTIAGIIAAPAPVNVSPDNPSRTVLKFGSRPTPVLPPWWAVTPATLSNAGRLVLLREKPRKVRVVEAVQVSDEELRGVVFGDPEMHSMELYKRRVDMLATAAVMGQAPD